MATATVQVAEFTAKDGKVPAKLKDGNNTVYATWDDALAAKAAALAGQQATITYTEKQNGEYTNRYLEGIEPVAGINMNGTIESTTHGDSPDWDAIAQAKTKCALYAGLFQNDSLVSYVASVAQKNEKPIMPEVATVAKFLVGQAMNDIFGEPPAPPPKDDGIPF